jgi:hypothetical protein
MKTLKELVAEYNTLASAAGKPTRKGFDSKALAEAAIMALRPKASATIKVRKATAVREKGPRGFKFGPVWMQSIRDGKGVALKPQNMPKLLDTAAFMGVNVRNDQPQAEIAMAIAKVI